MTNSARLSGRPSSSAAYNVGDVVDSPDSAIKSWRYLGAGEWEPNDAVRYTMGPGGGIEVCVGDISATIPELTAAQSAATLAAAEAAFAPQIVTGYYYVRVGGTRTSGKSTADDWSSANCYGSLQTAINQNWTAFDEIVLFDEPHTISNITTNGSTAATGATLTVRSASRDPDRCSVVFTTGNTTAINLNKAGATYAYVFCGIRFSRTTTVTNDTSAFLALSQMSGDVVFEDCILDGCSVDSSVTLTRGIINASSTAGARELVFRRMQFRNITTKSPGGSVNPFIAALQTGTTVTLDNVLIEDYQHTTTGDGTCFGAVWSPNITAINVINTTLRRVNMIHESLTSAVSGPFFGPWCPITIDGLVVEDCTVTGASSGTFGVRCVGPYTIRNVRGRRCIGQRAAGTDYAIGGLVLAIGATAIGTVRDIEAEDCKSDYGPVIYASQGASMVAKSIRGYNCTARGEGIVYSGGWGDTHFVGILLAGCRSGTSGDVPEPTELTGAIYLHQHDTLATRDKTATVTDAILIDCDTAAANGAKTLACVNMNATHSLTCNVDRIYADVSGERQIRAQVGTGATLILTGANIAVRGGESGYFAPGVGTVTGTVQIRELARIGDGTLTAATIDRDLARAWTEAMADAT